MQVKFQRTITLICSVIILVSFMLISFLTYHQNLNMLKDTVSQEAKYIALSMDTFGYDQDFLISLDELNLDTRISHIHPSGLLLYDSLFEIEDSPSRENRSEVQAALAFGVGEAIRPSDTTGERMFYYAVLLQDGNVLRVSRSMGNLVSVALGVLPYIIGLFFVMLIATRFIAKWQTARLMQPINNINLNNPLSNQVYPEFIPLMEAIEKKNIEENQISEMRKEFSANVSHELKTPLTSISGYAEIIMNGMVRSEDIPKFSERIFKEAKRLLTLIDDTIKLSRLDEGLLQAAKEDVELYSLCRQIISRLAPQAERKKVRMILTGEPIIYHGIPQLLDEMIYNLCDNAIKYNHERGRVYVWVGKTLEGIKISVSDTGIGIPPEDYERIFERFYRVDKSHSKETGGTGLGLSIVKHVAMLHDAKVTVDSTLGHGTKIEIRLTES